MAFVVRAALVGLALLLGAMPAQAKERDSNSAEQGIAGIEHFPGTQEERARLIRDGFIVLPRFRKQIFEPYIGGSLPYYITCDSAHWTFQHLLENAMRDLESSLANKLGDELVALHAALSAPARAPPSAWIKGHQHALAVVTVAARLMGKDVAAPAMLDDTVKQEVKLIVAAAGQASSPIAGRLEDYSDYRVRSIYEGDAKLASYFRAVKWMSRTAFRIEKQEETQAALLLARAYVQSPSIRTSWRKRDKLFDWLVGPQDDLSLEDYVQVVAKQVGADWSNASLEKNFDVLCDALRGLRDPEIKAALLQPDAWDAFRGATKGLRIMPARRTPDAWLFQTQAEEQRSKGNDRWMPSGLAVAAALGSKRAETHHSGALSKAQNAGFRERMGDTLYGDSLRAAALLFDEKSPVLGGSPASDDARVTDAPFLASDAWRDRLLAAGLSNWAGICHALALNTKTVMSAAGGCRDQAGVVEPTPRYFDQLAEMAEALGKRLDAAGAFDHGDPIAKLLELGPIIRKMTRLHAGFTGDERTHYLKYKRLIYAAAELHSRRGKRLAYPDYLEWLLKKVEGGRLDLDAEALAAIHRASVLQSKRDLESVPAFFRKLGELARKGIRGEKLSHNENKWVENYGKLAAEYCGFGGNSYLAPNRQMGLVIDVFSNPHRAEALEVGIGAAMEIYLVLPCKEAGKRLHLGGVHSYYEFPSKERLTDGEWIERVEGRRTPALPPWTQSYVARIDVPSFVKRIASGEMPDEVEHVVDERIMRALMDVLNINKIEHDDGKRASWAANALLPYVRSESHEGLVKLLLGKMLHVPPARRRTNQEVFEDLYFSSQSDSSVRSYVRLVGKMATKDDVKRIFALIEDPGDRSGVPTFLVRERLTHSIQVAPSTLAINEAAARLTHADPQVRRCAIVAIGSHMYGQNLPDSGAALLRALPREDNARNVSAILHELEQLYERIQDVDGTFALRDQLKSPDASIRKRVIRLLSSARAIRAAPNLLALASTTSDLDEYKLALESLGRILRNVPSGNHVRLQALSTMISKLENEDARFHEGAMKGLGHLGGSEAARALGTLAMDGSKSVGLRRSIIARLKVTGDEARPYLFRLLFDQTPTEHKVGDTLMQICHDALGALVGDPNMVFHEEQKLITMLEEHRRKARAFGYATAGAE